MRSRMRSAVNLLFVDDHLAVMDKPSGLLVHKGWGADEDVAMFRVRDLLGQHVFPVHRLDRGTSGVLVFARSSDVAHALSQAFEGGRVHKEYLALVRGCPPERGVIDHPIPRTEDGPRVPALTRFVRVAESRAERCALVRCMPASGRLHQVRRHMKHIHHPLIGDVNYGSGELNRHFRARYGLHRLALHAHVMALAHPVTGEEMRFTAPVPEGLSRVWATLGVWDEKAAA